MRDNCRRPLSFALCLSFSCILCACSMAPPSTEYRKLGAEYKEKWFNALPETPSLYKVIEIRKLTIHVVSDRNDFGWKKARDNKTGIAGYADTNNSIGILGKKIGREIIVNQLILGHEFKHILHFNDPDVVDPHDKATMEYCIGKELDTLCK